MKILLMGAASLLMLIGCSDTESKTTTNYDGSGPLRFLPDEITKTNDPQVSKTEVVLFLQNGQFKTAELKMHQNRLLTKITGDSDRIEALIVSRASCLTWIEKFVTAEVKIRILSAHMADLDRLGGTDDSMVSSSSLERGGAITASSISVGKATDTIDKTDCDKFR